MKKSYLLPRGFKKVGMVLAVCCLAWFTVNCFTDESLDFKFKTFALIGETPFAHASGDSSQSSSSFCNMVETSFGMTIAPVLMLTAFVFIAFSRNRTEDEYIMKIREQSFVWAMLVGYVIIALLTLLVFGFEYLMVMMYDIYIFLILFICKFHYEIYRLKKTMRDEE